MLELLTYKIYGAPAYMVVPFVVLVLIYVVLVVRFILHMRGLNVSFTGKKRKMALLLGPRHAGKTSFFHLIRDGEHVDTVSSMKEQTFRFVVHPKYNPDKFDAELTVVDYPGHERLRSYDAALCKAIAIFRGGNLTFCARNCRRVADFYPVAGCIAFFVDASDVPSFRKAAEYAAIVLQLLQYRGGGSDVVVVVCSGSCTTSSPTRR